MLIGVYPDLRQASSTSKALESGNYEAIVAVHCCQLQLIQPHIPSSQTDKQDRVTIKTSFPGDSQLLLTALQEITSGSVLLNPS